ncbi:MAG: hypothetical protein MUO59_01115 [Actinobacteria bacterium]|nr:hypothetical protein [Actinomycetota bacterium]
MPDYKTQGREQFESARFKSLLNNLKFFSGERENELLSFDEINKELMLHNQHYLGMKTVRVNDIVGSIDRYKDFDRYFLPKKAHLEHRWSNIYSAYMNDVILPVVKLYKVGDIYFVVDGNHRISVARRMKVTYIDAEVTEFVTKFPITREMDPGDMFILAEREKFLEVTGLKDTKPGSRIRLTIPGKYDFLLNRINDHMHYLNEKRSEGQNEIDFKQASLDWYDNVYLPARNLIDSYKIIENFPHRTKSDLYVWINAHKYYLRDKYGKNIGLADAAYDFSTRFSEGLWPHIKLFFHNLVNRSRHKDNKWSMKK